MEVHNWGHLCDSLCGFELGCQGDSLHSLQCLTPRSSQASFIRINWDETASSRDSTVFSIEVSDMSCTDAKATGAQWVMLQVRLIPRLSFSNQRHSLGTMAELNSCGCASFQHLFFDLL